MFVKNIPATVMISKFPLIKGDANLKGYTLVPRTARIHFPNVLAALPTVAQAFTLTVTMKLMEMLIA